MSNKEIEDKVLEISDNAVPEMEDEISSLVMRICLIEYFKGN